MRLISVNWYVPPCCILFWFVIQISVSSVRKLEMKRERQSFGALTEVQRYSENWLRIDSWTKLTDLVP